MKDIWANDKRSGALKINAITAAMVIVLVVMQTSQLNANIYSWTDAKGIKHFSNVPPPPSIDAAIGVRQEIAYDRDADEARWDLDQKDWEALKQELQEAEKRTIEKNYGGKNKKDRKSLAEKIQKEKFRLELEVSRLEKMPATSFAKNLDGKRAAIAFYQSRLKELETDPQRYFNLQ